MAHIGIFGPTLCGKTTLAKHLAREYHKAGYSCIALLLFPDEWPKGTWVTTDEAAFEWKVQHSRCCMVFVEEASSTVKRNRDKLGWFTAIRHRGHLLHCIGHRGTDLLPDMREQFTRLFLFRTDPEAVKKWVIQFTDKRIMEAETLNQYEYLDCRMFGGVTRCKLKV